jgi:hypothetical protein
MEKFEMPTSDELVKNNKPDLLDADSCYYCDKYHQVNESENAAFKSECLEFNYDFFENGSSPLFKKCRLFNKMIR